jgi:hypothetical protein
MIWDAPLEQIFEMVLVSLISLRCHRWSTCQMLAAAQRTSVLPAIRDVLAKLCTVD